MNNDIDKMIDYIINITVNPIFNDKLVNREKQAVHNEILETIDTARYKLNNKMSQLFYKIEGLKYAQNSEQQIKNLKKFNSKNLQEYYSKNYNNSNTIFVVSGNYDKHKIIEAFKSRLLDCQKVEKTIDYTNIDCFTNIKTTEFLKNNKLKEANCICGFLQD